MGFDYSRFDEARFDVRKYVQDAQDNLGLVDALLKAARVRAGDILGLTDAIRHRAQKAASESLSLADTLTNTISAVRGDLLALSDATAFTAKVRAAADGLGLSDQAWQGTARTVADTLTLLDSLTVLVLATRGDALGLADALASRPRPVHADVSGLADNLARGSGKAVSDVVALTDAFVHAVLAIRADQAALADMLSSQVGVSRADAMAIVDQVALMLARGAEAEVVAVADTLIRGVLKPASDTLTTSDALALRPGKVTADTATLADALVAAMRPSMSDLMAVTDALSKATRPGATDQVGTADSLQAATSRLLDHLAGIGDALSKHIRSAGPLPARFAEARFDHSAFDAAQGGDVAGLSDVITYSLGLAVLVDDVLALVDALAQRVAGLRDDLTSLADTVERKFGRPADSPAVEIADTLAKLPKPAASDLMALADTVARRAALSVAEALDLAEEWFFRWAGLISDTTSIADALQVKAGLAAEDAAALADAVVKLLWGRVDTDLALADAFTRLLGRPLESAAAALGDEVRAVTGKGAGEQLGAADQVAAVLLALRADSADLSDYLAMRLGLTPSDASSLADALVASTAAARASLAAVDDAWRLALGVPVSEPALDLLDSLQRLLARPLGSGAIGVADLVDLVARAAREETLDVTDILAGIGAGATREDVLGLAEDLARLVRVALPRLVRFDAASRFDEARFDWPEGSETLALEDAYSLFYVAIRQFAEEMGVEDAAWARFAAEWGEVVGLSDQASRLVRPSAGDIAGLVDGLALLPGKAMAEALGLADEALRLLAKLQADAAGIDDAVLAALVFNRQADELVGVLDQLQRVVRSWRDSALVLADTTWAEVRASRQEALELADSIGKGTTRPLPGDAVGILDEGRLLVALGLPAAGLVVDDSLRGKVRQLLSQVWIQGISVPVTGLSIRHSVAGRVPECTFKVIAPTAEVKAAAEQRAEVHAYLLDGVLDIFGGRIVGNPILSHGPGLQTLEITAQGYAAEAHDVYVSVVYSASDGPLTEWLKAVWEAHYPYPVGLTGVTHSERTVESLTFPYETLFEVTERVAQVLGWEWQVEWDGGTRRLLFYPPSATVTQKVFSATSGNFITGSARFGQDDQIVNAVWVLGGLAKSSTTMSDRFLADGERTAYRLRRRPYQVQAIVAGVPQSVGAKFLHNPEEYDCLIDFDRQEVEWREDNRPAKDAVVEAVYYYDYPVVAYLEDGESIRRYGRVERKLTDTNVRSIIQARDRARRYLAERAFPRGYGALEVLEGGIRAGDFVTVNLPALRAQGLYEVVEIHKWVEGGMVRRSLTLNVCDDPEERIARRLQEFARRLEALEQGGVGQEEAIQRFQRAPGPLAVRVSAVAAGDIGEQAGESLPLSEDLVETLTRTDYAWRRVRSTLEPVDCVSRSSAAQRDSVLGLREVLVAKVGDAVFGDARFDFATFADRREVTSE